MYMYRVQAQARHAATHVLVQLHACTTAHHEIAYRLAPPLLFSLSKVDQDDRNGDESDKTNTTMETNDVGQIFGDAPGC